MAFEDKFNQKNGFLRNTNKRVMNDGYRCEEILTEAAVNCGESRGAIHKGEAFSFTRG